MYYYKKDDYLMHHGIKGQKWGVRRFQNSDGSLTPAGRERYKYIPKTSAINNVGKGGFSYASQRALNFIPLVGWGISSAAEIYTNAQNNKLKDMKKEPKEHFDWKKKETDTPLQVDAKVINEKWGKAGTTNNCLYCSAAYEMRRRGYDVYAELSAEGNDNAKLSKWFKGAEQKDYYSRNTQPKDISFKMKDCKDRANEVESKLLSYGDGARGQITCAWGSFGQFTGAHSLSWEVSGGKIKIVDSQAGKTWDSLAKYCHTDLLNADKPRAMITKYMRLDNAKVDMKGITEALNNSRNDKWK